jgi:site-specific DNA-methyltransferase (adenine-specific)
LPPEINTIYCGDCLELMRSWPDKCVDWVISDPPYGIDAPNLDFPNDHGKGRCKPLSAHGGLNGWDDVALTAERFAEIRRVSKNWALFGANYFNDLLPPSCQWIVWDKMNGDCLFSHVELVATSRPGPDKIIRSPQNAAAKVHPTMKPDGVMQKLVNLLTNEGDTILDPFCGSGSTLAAAERLGRKWIGIDIDPHWCEVARRRTAQKGLQFAA